MPSLTNPDFNESKENCENVQTSTILFAKVENILSQKQLLMQNMVGYASDGSSNVSSNVNGLAGKVIRNLF